MAAPHRRHPLTAAGPLPGERERGRHSWACERCCYAGGLDRPTGGTVTVLGENVGEVNEKRLAHYRRRRIGMVFQFLMLADEPTGAAQRVTGRQPARW